MAPLAPARSGAAVLVVLLALALPAGATPAGDSTSDHDRPAPHQVRRQQALMGTVIGITIWTADEPGAQAAMNGAFAEFQRIEALMSSWTDTGDVAAINRAAGGKPVAVDQEVVEVVARAQEFSRMTSGAFDITIGAFKGLWRFGSDLDGSIPAQADVSSRRKLVGYRQLRVNGKRGTVQLRRPGMRITLGGIAKGYAVDRVVALLRSAGYTNFIIQAGGDLYAAGRKGERQWRVGIRDPRGERDAPFALTAIQDMTFSTSGDYERGFIKDGVRYHHILDPKTGRPATSCRSVTVMAPDALTADALSTSLFVLGPTEGLKLVEKLPRVEAVFVAADNSVLASSGFKLVRSQPTDLAGVVWILHDPSPGP